MGKGADIDAHVIGDETPLINATRYGHLSMVKFLVEQGADVNKAVRDGYVMRSEKRSPLLMARRGGHQKIAEYLVMNGAKE